MFRHLLIWMLSGLSIYSNLLAADNQGGAPTAVWETLLQSSSFEYELRGSAASANGMHIAVMLGLRPKGDTSGPQGLRLQILDADGKPRTDLDLSGHVKPTTASTRVHLGGMVVTDDGLVFFIIGNSDDKYKLLGVDIASNRVRFEHTLTFTYPGLDLSSLNLTNKGNLLLSGGANGKGFVAELNREGSVVWETSLDAPVAIVVEAVVLPEGYLLAGGSADTGTSSIRNFGALWAGETDLSGKVLRSQTWQGPSRFISAARSANGEETAIVFDQLRGGDFSESANVDVLGLKADLSKNWRDAVVESGIITAPYQIEAAATNGFWLVGVKNKGLLSISRLSESGQTLWQIDSDPDLPDYPHFHGTAILRAATRMLIVSSLSTVSDRRQQQVVKVAAYVNQ